MLTFTKQTRAKALLNLLDVLVIKHNGDEARGAAQLDKELGDMWREEVEAGGLGHEIPDSTSKDDTVDEKEAFYKKVKHVLGKNDLPEQLVDDGSSPCDKHSKKKNDIPKSRTKGMFGGKKDKGAIKVILLDK